MSLIHALINFGKIYQYIKYYCKNHKNSSDVQYSKKDGVHGVSYTSHLGEQGWTPVIGRRKKRIILDYIKRRFPPGHPIHKQESESDVESESDEHDLDKVIPAGGNVNVEYTLVDNTPGLSIKTRCTRSWTLVAARTRARLKKTYIL